MKRTIFCLILLLNSVGLCYALDPIEKIETIIDAKMVISEMISHNPTLTFHDEYTKVYANKVTLKFSFEDKKGITFTYILDVIVPIGDKNNEKTV